MFLKTANKMDRRNKSLNRDSDIFRICIDHDHNPELESEPVIIKDRRGLVKSVCLALGVHLVFFCVIAWFWQQASDQNQSNLIIAPEGIKINSYIITTEQYEAMVKASESKVDIDKLDINKLDINKLGDDEQNSNTEVETSIQPITPNDALPVSNLQQQVPAEPKDSNAPNINTPDHQDNSSNNAPTINGEVFNKAVASGSDSEIESVAVLSTHAISQASSQYLQQININELEALIGSQSAFTNKPSGTMSEMDPDLTFIELISKIDTSQPHTYNHRLDPNRIVKQGDYCYRVVNLATQVNPYGEGLGYAEYCGPDDMKTALTSEINNRLTK
ncbi:hypothetical protein [Shewanella sp. OMA3-2]|uniref:hypothetical protein n=1 Tax=Shewanella sp. OMA3-2 TaxID=2908650 RepID=UPI001F3B210D|nr:hypothetical protein [Shewanella sp. OMA3-2]UJF20908.1 hypothetical protein L0B17_12125 [Shewanella sp. OMA3-2]